MKKVKAKAEKPAKPNKFEMVNIPVTDEERLRAALDRFQSEGREIINVFSLNGRSFTFFTRL